MLRKTKIPGKMFTPLDIKGANSYNNSTEIDESIRVC